MADGAEGVTEGSSGARLDEIEIKLTLLEDLVEQLNDVVADQQRTIDSLVRELAHLASEREARPDRMPRSLSDELPPHY